MSQASSSDPITLYGFPVSNYVRTTHMVCLEKGLPCAVEPLDMKSDNHFALHPFGKIPAMRHGDVTLWESLAIATYLDRLTPDPALRPADAEGEARMNGWISASIDYLYPAVILNIVIERFADRFGRTTDAKKIADAIAPTTRVLAVYEAQLAQSQLAKSPYLVGDSLSLADLFAYPMLDALDKTPEATLLDAAPHIRTWMGAMGARASAQQTNPF